MYAFSELYTFNQENRQYLPHFDQIQVSSRYVHGGSHEVMLTVQL